MKLSTMLTSSLLLLVTNTQASEINFAFNATDNQDPIFIEKCLAYKQALVDGDKQKLLSFVDPKLQEKFGERLQNVIDKMIAKRKNKMQRADYELDYIRIVKMENM
ncbi:hypothetical protein, partial [Shewanella sp.]|uniref:hypothetical protein n=1 Tax=Shewanella sp. TaxID=50422 RepID=UPI003A985FC1